MKNKSSSKGDGPQDYQGLASLQAQILPDPHQTSLPPSCPDQSRIIFWANDTGLIDVTAPLPLMHNPTAKQIDSAKDEGNTLETPKDQASILRDSEPRGSLMKQLSPIPDFGLEDLSSDSLGLDNSLDLCDQLQSLQSEVSGPFFQNS